MGERGSYKPLRTVQFSHGGFIKDNKENQNNGIELKNEYEFKDNYVIGRTARKRNEFYFDIEDFDKVKQYYWVLDSSKNVICKNENPQLSMHKLIMGDGIYLHLNNKNNDNRKENLIPARGGHNNGKIYLNGYIAVYMPEHERAFDNGCVYEHVLVAEEILGRKLKPEECVHHKDKDRTNNSPDNLMIFQTNEDHIAYHGGAEVIQDDDGTYYCIKQFLKFTYYYRDRTRRDIDNNIIDIGSIDVKAIKTKDVCPYCETNFKGLNARMCIECYKQLRKGNKRSIIPKHNKVTKSAICPFCNTNTKSSNSLMCIECYNKNKRTNIPPREELESLIYNTPFTKIGEMYGVTDNAVRKLCKKYGLPYRKKDMDKTN